MAHAVRPRLGAALVGAHARVAPPRARDEHDLHHLAPAAGLRDRYTLARAAAVHLHALAVDVDDRAHDPMAVVERHHPARLPVSAAADAATGRAAGARRGVLRGDDLDVLVRGGLPVVRLEARTPGPHVLAHEPPAAAQPDVEPRAVVPGEHVGVAVRV